MTSESDETVGALAELYLGNILYAIERCALSLEQEGKPLDAAFYRGIGRKLADAHGAKRQASPPGPTGSSGPSGASF